MYSFTFTYSNTDSDPAIIEVGEWAKTDTTDVSAFGYTNTEEIFRSGWWFIRNQPGFVETSYLVNEPHRVVMVRTFQTEADRVAALENFRANTQLSTAYKDLMNRYRAAFNITMDPAPDTPPLYLP